jgi:hypothetical protein
MGEDLTKEHLVEAVLANEAFRAALTRLAFSVANGIGADRRSIAEAAVNAALVHAGLFGLVEEAREEIAAKAAPAGRTIIGVSVEVKGAPEKALELSFVANAADKTGMARMRARVAEDVAQALDALIATSGAMAKAQATAANAPREG